LDGRDGTVTLRRAVAADERWIRQISARIWDGHDYTGGVFSAWLSEDDGEVVVAVRDGRVVGYAHRKLILPGYAWFEGIRVDPAYEGGGVARAITRHLVEAARSDGARAMGLSTYIENAASMHIVETMGFSRIASFVFLEARPESDVRSTAQPSGRCQVVAPDEAMAFARGSRFLDASGGRLPRGWTFYPYAPEPRRALVEGHELIGIRDRGRLVALSAIARSLQFDGEMAIDFLEGSDEALEELVRHLLALARPGDVVQAMLPRSDGAEAPALGVLARLGFPSWNGLAPDVFVYERVEVD